MSQPAISHGAHPTAPADADWASIAASAPQLADTMCRYLLQAATFLAPRSVDSADNALRLLGRFLLAEHPDVRAA
jgi:hypothetical protein